MKPKPFWPLNHFTVPVVMEFTFQVQVLARPQSTASSNCRRGNGQPGTRSEEQVRRETEPKAIFDTVIMPHSLPVRHLNLYRDVRLHAERYFLPKFSRARAFHRLVSGRPTAERGGGSARLGRTGGAPLPAPQPDV